MLRTTKDIVIPAGTVLDPPPTHSTRWGKDHDTPIGVTADHVGYFSIDPEEALASGFFEEL